MKLGQQKFLAFRKRIQGFASSVKDKVLALADWLQPPGAIFAPFRGRPRTLLMAALAILYISQIWKFNISLSLPDFNAAFVNPLHWDHLMLSGYTLLFFGIWAALNLPARNARAVRRLVNRGALENTGNVESLLRALDSKGDAWSHRIAILLAITLAVVFVVGLRIASSPSFSFLITWALTGIIGGYLAGRFLGRMVAYGFLGLFLLDRGVKFNVRPGHIDRAGGFKPFGDFFFHQAMIVSLPALHLALWTFLIPIWPYNDYLNWTVVYISLLPVAILFVIFSFVLPMLSVHTIMKRKKARFLKTADKLGLEILDLRSRLEGQNSAEERQGLSDQLRLKTQGYHDIENMPTWPAAFTTIRLFVGNSVALAFPLIIELVKATEIWKGITERV